MTEQSPPPEHQKKDDFFSKSFTCLAVACEFTIRSIVFPATIGIFSPPEKERIDVVIRFGSCDV